MRRRASFVAVDQRRIFRRSRRRRLLTTSVVSLGCVSRGVVRRRVVAADAAAKKRCRFARERVRSGREFDLSSSRALRAHPTIDALLVGLVLALRRSRRQLVVRVVVLLNEMLESRTDRLRCRHGRRTRVVVLMSVLVLLLVVVVLSVVIKLLGRSRLTRRRAVVVVMVRIDAVGMIGSRSARIKVVVVLLMVGGRCVVLALLFFVYGLVEREVVEGVGRERTHSSIPFFVASRWKILADWSSFRRRCVGGVGRGIDGQVRG